MRTIQTGFVSLIILAFGAAAVKADSIFNFDNIALGTPTTFSDTNNGLTATFSSTDQGGAATPGGFIVYNNQFSNFGGGNNLYENDTLAPYSPANPALNQTLRVSLSSSILSLAFPFTLNAPAGSTLTLTAFNGATQIGTFVSNPSVENPGGGYSLGNLTFNPGQSFTSFTLGNVSEFAIDDLSLGTSTTPVSGVPEPASTALIILGFAAMLGYVRRQQRKRTLSVARR